MKLTITIDMDGAAFEDGQDKELEKIFKDVRYALPFEEKGAKLFDSNGNHCGAWELKDNG